MHNLCWCHGFRRSRSDRCAYASGNWPNYVWLTPNLSNDAHDTSIGFGTHILQDCSEGYWALCVQDSASCSVHSL